MKPQGIDPMDIRSITKFLTALGDPVRLQILTLLGNVKRFNVGEISAQFEISRPAISHHLKILKDADIVESQKVGQEVYYWLSRDTVVASLRSLADAAESYSCGE
ncbi:ArsR/SmtB family transcription factor [Cohnella abietis]|uniref:Transcriptional regulator n=1 Tax=Cohnella abietis TaxID=2507935 RepID=A0A3T1DCZ6_9BACL|nr:metalloregulator ArsR/SmtB family transcription factor [Cohnella abietis]BBI35815.1 transcriptional regulator [Cohnella abietis]